MTPRSPQIENDTSDAIVHSGKSWTRAFATDSCSAEWRALSSRSSSAPRPRGRSSRLISRAAATWRRTASFMSGTCPVSIRDTTLVARLRALRARSACRQPRFWRARLTAIPKRRSSTSGWSLRTLHCQLFVGRMHGSRSAAKPRRLMRAPLTRGASTGDIGCLAFLPRISGTKRTPVRFDGRGQPADNPRNHRGKVGRLLWTSGP